MLDQLGQLYLLVDTDGVIVEANDTFLSLTGYGRKQVLGQRGHEMFMAPGQREQRRREFLEAIATETLPTAYDRSVLTQGGQPRLVHWRTGYTRDSAGKVTGVWMAGREANEMTLASPALANDSTHLQDFLDNAQDLVQHLSATNAFLFVNKAWKE